MIKIGICDDNLCERTSVKREIELCLSKYNICYQINEYENAEKLLIEKIFFDILFLDIDMPVINGIELGKKIRLYNKKVKIIYVTGYADYVYAAYDVHAFYYLLKPINSETIQKKLSEVLEYLNDKSENKIVMKTTSGTVFILPEEICYFEFYNRKIKVVSNQQEYLINGTLYELLTKVKVYGFAMPHKAFIVNMHYISKIASYNVYLSNGKVIPLAEKKSAEFKMHYNDFLQEVADKI